ncbi:ATP-binding protein [Modestobacter sp. NPDC049651]|uniref:ATP-binding protein n=1 Tax=unclassified Modestobacter TaxID=2643866 RepID=UPI0033FDBABB
MPAVPSSLPTLRRELSALLRTSRLSEDESYDLLLSVFEAAGIALEHAQAPREAAFLDIVAWVDEATVTEHGRSLAPTAGGFRGRGLQMMHALTDTSVATGGDGTTVTIRGTQRPPTGRAGRAGVPGQAPRTGER